MELHRVAIFLFIGLLLTLAASILISINNNRDVSIIVQNNPLFQNNYPAPKTISSSNQLDSKSHTNSALVSIIKSFQSVQNIELSECNPIDSLDHKTLRSYNFSVPKTWQQISSKYQKVLSNQDNNYEIKHSRGKNFFIQFKPKFCKSKQCVAILIPARNRDVHLRHLLYHLPEILMKQQACFGIYVLDQFDNSSIFNKAKLYNSGILEARKDKEWDCYAFHDVDLLPRNETILYECSEDGNVRHISVGIDKYNYKLRYDRMVGGVSLLNETTIQRINGWSNSFWGWGGEDDNLFKRIEKAGYRQNKI